MKTYVLTVSTVFPKGHIREGDPTFFKEKITTKHFPMAIKLQSGVYRIITSRKLHTIRSNYQLWARRIAEIQAGRAVLSVRQWSGKPYRSKQIEIALLTARNGVGVQRLELTDFTNPTNIDGYSVTTFTLALNDGLNWEDWKEWFKDYDLTQPLVIIHFTKYRY